MNICKKCGKEFLNWIIIDGKRRNLESRKYCLDCSPFGKHRTRPINDKPLEFKKCPACDQIKKINEFYEKPRRRTRSGYCKECTKRKRAELNKKTKEQMIEYKGRRCIICGYDKYKGALDFHHIDPNEKDPDYKKMRNWTFEKRKEELDKCILVCSNCHREIHAGLIEEYKITI